MRKQLKIFRQKENGSTLIETLISIILLSIVGVAVMGCLILACNVLIKTDNRDTARDLAEAQIEIIQAQPYDDINNPPVYPVLAMIPDGFTVAVTSNRLDTGNGITEDTGIQHITVSVSKGTVELITLEGQKSKW